jgi:hypothetical protein
MKKPSLAELLRGSVSAAPSAYAAVTSTALHMQMHVHTPMQAQPTASAAASAPPSAGKKKGGGANVVTAAAAASTSLQGIAIFGGIKSTAAASSSAGPSAPFSFSKQSGKGTPQQQPSRKSR